VKIASNVGLSLRSNTIIVLSYIFALSIVYSTGFTQTSGTKINTFFAQMEDVGKTVNTLKADYTQKIFFISTQEKQESSGTLFLKKPTSIYIQQRVPQERHLYIDAKNITIYTPENEQAVIDSLNNIFNDDFVPATIINLGNNWRKIKKTNLISLIEDSEKHTVITITPVENKNCSIKIYISKTNMYPIKATAESEGVISEIIFRNYVINPAFDKNIFKFNVPDNVEIIKLN
jgi:outer membrane lipoprotein carrier protein